MKVGDLIKIKDIFTSHGIYEREHAIGMIIAGPNEVGKVRVLLSCGKRLWLHAGEVEYMPRERKYLKE